MYIDWSKDSWCGACGARKPRDKLRDGVRCPDCGNTVRLYGLGKSPNKEMYAA